MFKVDEDLTRNVATLARLRLTEAEVKELTPQLEKVLEYVSQLDEVSVEGVEPIVTPIEISPALREDEPREETLSIAEEGYRVPPVL